MALSYDVKPFPTSVIFGKYYIISVRLLATSTKICNIDNLKVYYYLPLQYKIQRECVYYNINISLLHIIYIIYNN